MSRIKKIAILVIFASFIAGAATAQMPAADGPERNTLEVNIQLTIQFPGYPNIEPITFSAYRTNLVFWIESKGIALMRGEDFPRLTYSTKDAPGKLDALTVILEGIPGTTMKLDWTSYPDVILYPVDIRAKAYTNVLTELTRDDQPIVDVILSDLRLSKEEVCVDGFCASGYLDAENLEAQLVFATDLPDADYPLYKEWLAGEPIIGELRIQLPNPFAEK